MPTSCSAFADNSMINAGILDGDIVVIRRRRTPEDGEIVAALVRTTSPRTRRRWLRFYRDGTQVRLQPENDALDAMFPDYVQVWARS